MTRASTPSRSLRTILAAFAVWAAVSAGCSPEDGPPADAETVCVYHTAMCLEGLCSGCTAGGLSRCPPAPDAFSKDEYCSSFATDEGCFELADPRKTGSTSAMKYVQDLRILRGVGSCSEYFDHPERVTPELVCDECP
jgi:hypothetical protein